MSLVTVSGSVNIPIEFIFSNLQYPWDWAAVSKNPNLTPDIILKYPNQKWNYKYISSNLMTYHPVVYSRSITNYIMDYVYIIQNISVIICNYV
jgi:hypothetical protein